MVQLNLQGRIKEIKSTLNVWYGRNMKGHGPEDIGAKQNKYMYCNSHP